MDATTPQTVGTDLVSVRKRKKLLLQLRTDTRSVPTEDETIPSCFLTVTKLLLLHNLRKLNNYMNL